MPAPIHTHKLKRSQTTISAIDSVSFKRNYTTECR